MTHPSGYPSSGGAGMTQDSGRGMSGLKLPSSGLVTAMGAGQILLGIMQNRKAKSMMPSLTDPSQTAFLSDLNMKRKNIGYSGAAMGFGTNMIQNNLNRTVDAISKVSTGNTGSVLAALTASQAAANTGVNQLAASEAQREMQLTGMAEALTDKIAQRKLDIEMYNAISKKAQAQQNISSGFDNLSAGAGGLVKKIMGK